VFVDEQHIGPRERIAAFYGLISSAVKQIIKENDLSDMEPMDDEFREKCRNIADNHDSSVLDHFAQWKFKVDVPYQSEFIRRVADQDMLYADKRIIKAVMAFPAK